MSEAELWELILLSQSNAATYIAIFLTVASGYLVMAFVAGARLLRSQIVIVNTIFIVGMMISIGPTYAAFSRAAFLVDFASPEYTSTASAGIKLGPAAIGVFGLMVAAACLTFMWQIRHPKSE
jgi:hypothetical protein